MFSRRKLKLFVAASATIVLVFSGCGGTEAGDPGGPEAPDTSGERIAVGNTEALVWGDGEQGVVLSHGAVYDAASWRPQAEEMAGDGTTVIAVEDPSPESLLAAAEYLETERETESVAFIGASAGAAPVLSVGSENPEVVEQMVILSATGDVSSLGEYPKFFVATEGEGMAEQVREMAGEAPGSRNEALILEGDAHAQAIFETDQGDELLDRIVSRLEEY